MKRRQNSSIFPLHFVLFMTAVFAAVILLPIAAGASMGTLDLPVSHTLEGETLYLTPEAGWSIQSVQLSEDSVLTAETGTDRAAVSLQALPGGGAEELQVVCREQGGEENPVSLALSKGADGAVTLRFRPAEAEIYNVSYLYEYGIET